MVLLLLLLATLATAATTTTTTTAPAVEVTSSTPSSSRRNQHFAGRTRFSFVRTTTPVPPSLPRPPQLRRRFSTTTISPSGSSGGSSTSSISLPTSTTSPPATAAKMAQRQRRLPQATRQHAASASEIITSKPAIVGEASTLASTRLVRHVDATTPKSNSNKDDDGGGGGIRQHRSFQTNSQTDRSSVFGEENGDKTQFPTKRRTFGRTVVPTEGNNNHNSAAESPSPRYQRFRTTTNYNKSQSSSSATTTAHFDGRQLSLKSNSASDDDSPTKLPPPPPSPTGNSNNIKLTTRHNQQQTPKTPRMIHRLVAGHIQNNDNRPAASSNNSTRIRYILPLNTDDTSPLGSRNNGILSSSYRDNKLNANIRIDGRTTTTTTTETPTSKGIKNTTHDEEGDYHDDDEALLDDSGDFDNWDNGILRLSAGSGKENTLKSKKNKDESKKTLADQVKDGKYGLIEKELFRRPPKRPGVLSYLPNKEVPEDNERNYGGLNEEDIWLAEDHLLVIKGGSLNEDNPAEPWPAIDDYNAAGRQIKIPDNPKVPPPFPVQLEENGPVQLIGNNKLTVVYPIANEPLSIYSGGSAGPEVHNASPESDSDDEKNLITRPGALKGVKENEDAAGGYNYASPPLPWLVANNKTSVDSAPPLNKGVNYPVLGPFLYGRNGSLDNATDDFDEDDPSLYYPPPYSFVYKSNYTNPVPPGPLVPGIVVPPPPDQFSKLEKSEKERRPSHGGVSTPIRYRVYSTTSTTTPLPIVTTTTTAPTTSSTTTTTTTTTTTESPYRNTITKITEYTPKIIHIASPSPRPVYTPTASPAIGSRIPTTTSPPPSRVSLQNIQPVPVPVAVPIPIYPANVEQSIRPGTISFVPTTPEPNVESFSKSNPIYYEYFEAKRQHQPTSQIFDEFLSTTVKPYPTPSPKPIKLYNTSKRPYKNRYLQNNVPSNHRYVDENIVVITPKPELRQKQRPYYKPRPLHNFEQDVSNVRDSLRYYQNQELRDNNIPRTPKAKPVFDYNNNYETTKSVTSDGSRNTFQPPLEYDVEPFQPMVTYSPPVGDDDAFKAVNLDKADNISLQPQGREEPAGEQELYSPQPKYVSTTTLVPIQQPERSKKLRAGAKYLQQHSSQYQQQRQQQFQQQQQFRQQQQQQQLEYNRWVAVNKQEFETRYTTPENAPRQRERYQEPAPILQPQRNRDGYYYGPSRQNNRFYEEPFQNAPNRKIINYRPAAPPTSAPQVQQQQLAPQPLWSLENDTYVNYAPNRPPLNPDAEFINPYQTIPINTYQQQQQQQQQTQ
uniref:Uncharacterized protein n=1 Tax=Musca domestica TaxID=7370 RepID=A0A1I8M8U3_MUSDO